MGRREKAALADAIFNSIDLGDLAGLERAIAEAGVAEKRTWLLRKMAWGSQHATWSNRKRGGRTPIGMIIDMRWIEALRLVEPMTDMAASCDKFTTYSRSSPSEKCAESGWEEGLAIVARRSALKQKMGALLVACVKSNLKCAKILLDEGTPVMPEKPLTDFGDCNKRCSPLHAAVAAGASECVLELLARGAKPSQFTISHRSYWSPLMMGLKGSHPDWALLLPMIDWMLENIDEPSQMDVNTRRDEFMTIMENGSHVAGMLAFKNSELDGEELLWKMVEKHDPHSRDVEGHGLVHWATRDENNPASQRFNARVLRHIGWKGAIKDGSDLGSAESLARREHGSDSDINKESAAAETSDRQQDAGMVPQAPSKRSARGPSDMEEALEECLAAMGSMASAVAKLAACVSSREDEQHQQGAIAAAEELRGEALSLVGKTRDVRDQISRIAGASAPPKTSR